MIGRSNDLGSGLLLPIFIMGLLPNQMQCLWQSRNVKLLFLPLGVMICNRNKNHVMQIRFPFMYEMKLEEEYLQGIIK